MALALDARLEALLFASGEPISKKRVAQLLDADASEVADAISAFSEVLSNRGLALIETDTDIELRTSPEAADTVRALRESELSKDLGKASLETLAYILYAGGATRSDIDWIRGVNSSAAVRMLLLRGLIERSEDPEDKRRVRYIPTVDALAHLGVSRATELPRFEELTQVLRERATSVPNPEQ